MRKLIEAYRRKADWDEEQGTWVTLSDGQRWSLARPWLEVRPIFREGKCVSQSRMLTAGELDPLVEMIGQTEAGLAQAMAVLTLGALLLQRRYDVTDEEMGKLFILRPGNTDSDQMLRDIIDVATGRSLLALGPVAVGDPKA